MRHREKSLSHRLNDYFLPHSRNNYRPHVFRAASVFVLTLAVLAAGGAYLAQTKLVFLKTDFLASVLPGALVDLTNQDRAALGLGAVTEDSLLDTAAQAAADDMAAKGYFAHVSPSGKTPWDWLDQVGYRYSYAGQNLAVNFSDSGNVEAAWMASPTHRANITGALYTRVGFGIANGTYQGRDTTFVVEFFATPTPAVAARPAPVSPKPSVAAAPAPTAPVQVLGSQDEPAPAAGAARESFWFAKLATAPMGTLSTTLTVLFSVVILLFLTSLIMRGHVRHPSMLISGTLLLLLIVVTLLIIPALTGPVELSQGARTAAADAAFAD